MKKIGRIQARLRWADLARLMPVNVQQHRLRRNSAVAWKRASTRKRNLIV